MALDTNTLLALTDNLMQENGDYLKLATTTNAATTNAIVSTSLAEHDEGRDGYFDDWWLYMNTTNNASVERKTGLPGTTTYSATADTLTIMGAALTAETTSRDFYLTRYKRGDYKNAILEAVKRIYPALHIPLTDETLITGNILPDGHFESWSSATALTHYTVLSGTLARTDTSTYIRGGTYSAKYTAGAANDYFDIDSDDNKNLLQLQGQGFKFTCQVQPATANDAYLEIYYIKTDGTTGTLTSTTTNTADEWTEIKLEDTLPSPLEYISVRFKIATDGEVVYFDDAYLGSQNIVEYVLPDSFAGGHVSQCYIQQTGFLTEMFYDTSPFMEEEGREVPFEIFTKSTLVKGTATDLQYIKIPKRTTERRIKLVGFKPLETLSADTDTLTLDTERVPLLIARAKYEFWKRQVMPLSRQDTDTLASMKNDALLEYRYLLSQLSMARPSEIVKR